MLMGMLVGVALSVSGVGSGVAADTTTNSKAEAPKGPRAIIKTKFGDIEIKLYPDVAPKHVENFTKLAKSGFYNGT
ncbi:MAG: peptidylprolyl isomerase, partial [Nitrospirota bacterium]